MGMCDRRTRVALPAGIRAPIAWSAAQHCLIGEPIGLKMAWIVWLMKRPPGSPLLPGWRTHETGPVPRIAIKGTHGTLSVVYIRQKTVWSSPHSMVWSGAQSLDWSGMYSVDQSGMDTLDSWGRRVRQCCTGLVWIYWTSPDHTMWRMRCGVVRNEWSIHAGLDHTIRTVYRLHYMVWCGE